MTDPEPFTIHVADEVLDDLHARLERSRRFPAVQRYVSGSVFVGLGAVAALSAPVKQN